MDGTPAARVFVPGHQASAAQPSALVTGIETSFKLEAKPLKLAKLSENFFSEMAGPPPLKEGFLKNLFAKPEVLTFLPIAPKPIIRDGFVLPPMDLKKLGFVDFFGQFGVNIGSMFNFKPFVSKIDFKNLYLRPFPSSFPSLLEVFDDGKRMSKEPLSTLSPDGVVERFTLLTGGFFRGEEDIRLDLLQELLANDAARRILLAPGKDMKSPIEKAWDCFFSKKNTLQLLVSHQDIVDHLGSIQDVAGGYDLILKKLVFNVVLNQDDVIPVFYQNPLLFQHVRAYLAAHKASPYAVFIPVGLSTALSSRHETDLRKTLNPLVMDFVMKEEGLLTSIIDPMIQKQNPALARILLEEQDVPLTAAQALATIETPVFWSALSEPTKSRLFAGAAPTYSRDQLEERHRVTLALEHSFTSHPAMLQDLEALAPDLSSSYPKASLIQKQALEKAFIERLRTMAPTALVSAPWVNAAPEAAFTQGFFGQDVKVLVVELGVLADTHKEGLLKSHLGPDTSSNPDAHGSRTEHNLGITSLVKHIAPLAEITSTTTTKGEALLSEAFPFINCSWGPTRNLDKDTAASLFGSSKSLNDRLGNEEVLLIQAAGNEGISLSHAFSSSGDPSGIFYATILQSLPEEKLSNVILALNIRSEGILDPSSNTPGYQTKIGRNSLCAQGTNTLWIDETGAAYRRVAGGGTSSAAPLITGAAALLKNYKPDFTPVQIKKCLLHSARRAFDVPEALYSMETHGMGVLHIPGALSYADALESHLARRGASAAMTFEEYEDLRSSLHLK